MRCTSPDSYLWEAVTRFVRDRYPHFQIDEVCIRFANGRRVCLAAPDPGDLPSAPPPFKPNEMQEAILEALTGGPLTADALAERSGYDRRTLYRKPGGLAELQAAGLVVKVTDGYSLPAAG